MGLFDKIFGGKEEKAEEKPIQEPIQPLEEHTAEQEEESFEELLAKYQKQKEEGTYVPLEGEKQFLADPEPTPTQPSTESKPTEPLKQSSESRHESPTEASVEHAPLKKEPEQVVPKQPIADSVEMDSTKAEPAEVVKKTSVVENTDFAKAKEELTSDTGLASTVLPPIESPPKQEQSTVEKAPSKQEPEKPTIQEPETAPVQKEQLPQAPQKPETKEEPKKEPAKQQEPVKEEPKKEEPKKEPAKQQEPKKKKAPEEKYLETAPIITKDPPRQETKKQELDQGLKKTKRGIFDRLSRAVAGKATVDVDVLDDIEQALIESDVGVDTTIKIIDRLEARVAKDKYLNTAELYSILKEEIVDLLTENNTKDHDDFVVPDTKPYPYVMMIVGVNGVGKTTTIGKLAYHFKKSGKSVVLGAADTFRAAAVDQLQVWADRVDVPIVKQGMGSDPAAVAFDTVESAFARKADVVMVDTAGRLHNKKGLMEELGKIKRVMQKVVPEVPHDVMLVLDGSTGQNALEQAKQFSKVTEVTCLAITKLDGTAKGGVVLGIADQLKVPIRYIGVGEKLEHLHVFNKADFVNSLFEE